MPDPIKWNNKILLAKIEATYGTDPAPGETDAIYAIDVSLSPMEGSDESRNLEKPHMGADETIVTELHAKLSFKVELQGSGTAGTAPAWGKLLRACAVAEVVTPATSVVYNPVTDGHESVSIYLWIDGTRFVIPGCRGNAKLMVSAQGVPQIEFSFTGLYMAPSETARVTPDLSSFQKPDVASHVNTPTFTVNGTGFVMLEAALDLGNAVENRFLIGREEVRISEKAETFEAKVEAQPLSAFDPFALAKAQSRVSVALAHGTEAGKIATLDVPSAQVQRLTGLENSQNVTEWPLRLTPLPVAGNDQWTLTLT